MNRLLIKQLELMVNLGWTQSEQMTKQTVLVDLEIIFPHPPQACQTDNLNDTLCYHSLIEKLQENIPPKSYKLIEYLGASIYSTAKKYLPPATKLRITITKYPIIPGLRGGVSFSYEHSSS